MKRKLGINANCLNNVSELDALKLIKATGFDSVFISTYDQEQTKKIKAEADRMGLTIEFIHAPFSGINEMWIPGMGYLHIFNEMKATIDCAAANHIPVVIIHVSSGWNAPQVNDLGLSRYDDLVIYAKEKGITVAFENLRMLGNLACLVDRYEHMDNVAFCYDCGHEHCYTKTVRWMNIFTFKACCTHIHDNVGRPFDDKVSDFDQHLLPFHGTCDYALMMRELDKYEYTGSLMLEVTHGRPEYRDLSCEEFLATAFDRIKRISTM